MALRPEALKIFHCSDGYNNTGSPIIAETRNFYFSCRAFAKGTVLK